MAKATRTNTRKTPEPVSENYIIDQCIMLGQTIAGTTAGYDCDPSGNSDYADKLSSHLHETISEKIEIIANLQATTAHALAAKARVMPYFLDHACGDLGSTREDFVRRFAMDVKEFLDEITEAEYREKLTQERLNTIFKD